MSKFFDELMESVKQMDKIVQGKRQPAGNSQERNVPNQRVASK
ncbi:hypothetical protein [Pseudomonas sp. T1.Ur]|nr:hypothetical protein [Pseudomonas sp. T1.Ur]